MGFVTVHYHRIESTLTQIPRLWQADPAPASSTASAADDGSTGDIQPIAEAAGKGAPVRMPLRVLISRFMAAALTAASASAGLVFGIRQGYKLILAIPPMYWQRPGRIVAG
mmetsp:Transcript_26357/g.85126  ORF Transcript_26357/g.85126 Transcript_26357/m.85126 type:complete len:111 (+) Transcript_26357:1658-1990(+)